MSGDPGLVVASARGRWVIAAAVSGSGVATLDATVVGIALPAIGRDYHAGVASLQWVLTGYSLTLASLLLLGGSLGDRLGRRRVFLFGVLWFAAASVACGLAPDCTSLIVARIIQGIGGALLTPSSLAILQASFRPEERARAIGAWSAFGGLANAAGPLIGGYLIADLSWRWVFFINVPVAAFVVSSSLRHVPESMDPQAAARTDVGGAALAMLALSALVFGLIEGPVQGWSQPVVVASLAVTAVAFPCFFVYERRHREPMLPLGLFANRQFTAANAVTFLVYAALGGALFLLPVVLQISAGYRPLNAGLALLPVTVIMLIFSARSGRLAARIGPRLQMTVGPVITGAGLALLAWAGDPGPYAVKVLPAIAIFGAGLAITVAPLTSTAMGAAPAEHAGTASAVNNVVARAAGLLAVAILPVAAGITGASALQPAPLAHGFRLAVIIAGIACAGGGLIAAVGIRNRPTRDHVPDANWAWAIDGPALRSVPKGER